MTQAEEKRPGMKPVMDPPDQTEPTERRFRGRAAWAIMFLGAAMTAYFLFTMQFRPLDPYVVRGTFLAAMSVLGFLYWRPAGSRERPWTVAVDTLLVAASISVAVYVVLHYKEMVFRIGVAPTTGDLIFGAMLTVATLEITRRTLGPALPILAVAFLLYALFGNWIPGVLRHPGQGLDLVISTLFSVNGIYGVPLAVSVSYLLVFIAFGAILEASGAGRFMIDLAYALAGRTRGGSAKVAVISSAAFGSVNGSPVANVVTTGVMTIPMMKQTGFRPAFAGAVEAVASTGGQLLPPVMGASAFIMVEILGRPYYEIAIAALIPALLYYVMVFWVVDLEAGRMGFKGIPRERVPKTLHVLKQGGHLLIPVIVLAYVLIIAGMTPLRAGGWGILTAIAASWLRPETRVGPKEILEAFSNSAKRCIPVVAATAAAGIIVAMVGVSGIGHKFASIMIGFSQGILLLALLLTAIIAIVLGIGMPTTGAYIVAASLLPAALIPMGADPLAVHLFLLYFANISNITPPVALAAYAAAGIANARPMDIAVVSFRLGLAGFLIPFMFVFSEPLLLRGTAWEIVPAVITALIGILALGIALLGWFLVHVPLHLRLVLAAGAILLIHHTSLTDVIGLAALTLVGGWILRTRRRQPSREDTFNS